MIDIDFFKAVNDTYGHQTGDKILCELAKILVKNVRDTDKVVRYGGEEFAIILPHTDHEGASVVGERLRSYIDKAEFVYKGDNIPLTISIGISCIRKDDDINGVFERADNALRLAKQAGRNRVVIDEETD